MTFALNDTTLRAANALHARPTHGAGARWCNGRSASASVKVSTLRKLHIFSRLGERWTASMPADGATLLESATMRSRHAQRYRVLMTADTVGGVWQYSLELSRALIARGHQVLLATMGGLPNPQQRAEAAAIKHLHLVPSAFKLLWMPDAWRDVEAAAQWLMGIAARWRPGIVHLNDFGHGHLPWGAPVLTVGHSCVLSWWQAVHGVPAPVQWARYKRRVTATLAASNLVVAPTHAMLASLEHHYGSLRNSRVIFNGSERQASGSVSKAHMIFAAGRVWDAGKNIKALAAAAEGLPWPVCVAGPEQSPDGERAKFQNVCMLGALDGAHVLRWLARASIYALPARYEPFGLSVLEAARARCALVLGDLPSLRETWNGAALFVDPDDHKQLARVLRALITDDKLRARYATRAQQRAQCYTAAAMGAAYAQAYAELDMQSRGFGQGRAVGGAR
jgi:glycogen(starch) synthase